MQVAPSAIELDHVSYAIGTHVILDNISVKIPHGVTAGIIGPNGAGKTTLVELLVGLLTPQTGDIRLFGETPLKAREGGRIGYVPQRISQSHMQCPATVEEVVRSGRRACKQFGQPLSAFDRERIEVALHDAGIENFRHRHMSQLSGGERQKVFIARALTADPHLLILDEPTTGVDERSQASFFSYLRHLKEHHDITILLVLHDIAVVAKEADIVLCLNRTLSCTHQPSHILDSSFLSSLYGPHHSPLIHTH